jgi:hypothetical protein
MALDEASTTRPPALEKALEDTATALRSDGFGLAWSVDDGGRVSFAVDADDADCAECLVPKPVLEAMLGQALQGTSFTVGDVRMPALP